MNMADQAVLIFKQDCHEAPWLELAEVLPKSLRQSGTLAVCEEERVAEDWGEWGSMNHPLGGRGEGSNDLPQAYWLQH